MGRTSNSGQGSVYRRGKKWRGQITIDGERLSFTADKRSDVNNWLAKMRTDSNYGIVPKRNTITVEEFGKTWLEKKIKPTVSVQTYNRYEKTFNRHFFPAFGKMKLQALTTSLIETKIDELFDSTYSDEYVKGTCRIFKRMLNYAVDQKILVSNPYNGITIRQRKPTLKVSAYTEEEQSVLIPYLKSNIDPKNAVLYLLITTGMRVGEALALNVEDVNLKKKNITINKTMVLLNGSAFIQQKPKTSSSDRIIYISDNTVKYLKSYIDLYGPNDCLFENLNQYSIRDRFKSICSSLNIQYRRVHGLRHTWATRALEKGIDIKTVSTLLGHANVLTTMNIYQDVYPEQKIKAAKIMDDLF